MFPRGRSAPGRLHGSLVMTISGVTENGWKSVPLENVNCVNLNRFRLKRLSPIEHDHRNITNKLFWPVKALGLKILGSVRREDEVSKSYILYNNNNNNFI